MTAVQPSLLGADLTPAPDALPPEPAATRRKPRKPRLPKPRPTPTFGLVVNEILIYTTTLGADWWTQHRHRFDTSGQTRSLGAAPPGEIVELGPWLREDADFARNHMISNGVPKGALKIRRWTDEPKPVAPRPRPLTPAEKAAAINRDTTLAAIVARAPDWTLDAVKAAAIAAAREHETVSANELRKWLPTEAHINLGAAVRALSTAGILIPTGQYVPSDLEGTNGHKITIYEMCGGLETEDGAE